MHNDHTLKSGLVHHKMYYVHTVPVGSFSSCGIGTCSSINVIQSIAPLDIWKNWYLIGSTVFTMLYYACLCPRCRLAHTALSEHEAARDCYQRALALDANNESYKNNLEMAQKQLQEMVRQLNSVDTRIYAIPCDTGIVFDTRCRSPDGTIDSTDPDTC